MSKQSEKQKKETFDEFDAQGSKRCQAYSKRSKKQCGKKALNGKDKCKNHAGGDGPPKGNTNAATPGSPRSKFLDAEQQRRLKELEELSPIQIMQRAMLLGVMKAEYGELGGLSAATRAAKTMADLEDRAQAKGNDGKGEDDAGRAHKERTAKAVELLNRAGEAGDSGGDSSPAMDAE